jgi:hypothetical protein
VSVNSQEIPMTPSTLHRLEHAAIAIVASVAGIAAGLHARPEAPPAPAPILYRAERNAASDARACAIADTRYLKLPPLSSSCRVLPDTDAAKTCGENPAGFVVRHVSGGEILVSDCQRAHRSAP